jgi:hypothetical protein
MSRQAAGRWALAGFALALALSVAGLLRVRAVPPEPDRTAARVVLIGVRGLSWGTAASLFAEGRMPALASITRGEAAVGDVIATGYGTEGEVLASVVTGRLPFKHGVHGFAQARLFRDQPVPSRVAVWDWMARRGERVGVVGFPFDPVLPQERAVVVTAPAPAEVPEEPVERIVGDAALPPELRAGLQGCLASDLAAASRAGALMRADAGRHVFLYLQGLHRWRHDLGARGELLRGYYDVLDGILADLYTAGDGNTTFMLFSERGNPEGRMTWRSRFPRLQHWPPIGFFLAWGRNIRHSTRDHDIAPPDLAPTLLYLSDNPLPTDMDGAVLFGMIDEAVYARRKPAFRP